MSGLAKKHLVKVLKAPPRLTIDRVPSCPRPPEVIWEESEACTLEIKDQDTLTRCYASFVENFVGEIIEATGGNANDKRMHQARARKPEFIEVDAFAGCNGFPAANAEARLWRELQGEIEQYEFYRSVNRHDKAKQILVKLLRKKPKVKPVEWIEWRKQVRLVERRPFDKALAESLLMRLGSMALTLENKAAAQREWSWKSWCKEKAAEPGATKIHSFLRGGAPWPQFLSADSFSAKPQVDAECRAKPWHDIWETQEEQPQLDWRGITENDANEVLLPSYDEFVRMAPEYPLKTSVGVCGIHPRHAAMASRPAHAAICKIWRGILKLAVLPTQLAMLLIALIPKPAGGDRPVGLFPTVLR